MDMRDETGYQNQKFENTDMRDVKNESRNCKLTTAIKQHAYIRKGQGVV